MPDMGASPDQVDAGAAHLLLALTGLQPDEVVLLVTDETSDQLAVRAVGAAVETTTARLSQTDPAGFSAYESAHPDLVISLAAPLLTHSDRMRRLLGGGSRYLNLRGVTVETLADVGQVDFLAIQTVTEELASYLGRGGWVSVADPMGTSLRFRAGAPLRLDGLALKPGSIGGYPAGEVALVPAAESLSGQINTPLFVEGCAERTPDLTLRVEVGAVTDVSGGPAAAWLTSFFDASAGWRLVGEFGAGTNPSLAVRTAREAKKRLGTAHFGLGDNRSFGGTNAAPGHLDVILAEPEVSVDGTALLRGGRPVWRDAWK